MNQEQEEAYKELAIAVVTQAVYDYETYAYKLSIATHHNATYACEAQLLLLEEFFLSDRLKLFTGISGASILEALKNKAAQKVGKRRQQKHK